MEEITIPRLIDLLEQPLAQEGMGASEILLLRGNFRRFHPGMGVSCRDAEERNRQLAKFGLPEGELALPVQYTNGEYTDMGSKEDKTFLSQGIATVFHPEFYEGRAIISDDDKPYRPLVDGYLDFSDERVLQDRVEIPSPSKGPLDSPSFYRAIEYHDGLWIAGEAENDSEGLVKEHLNQFARLYKIREFLREPERSLVDKAFRE